MYTGVAALLLAGGYIYKTRRDKRDKEKPGAQSSFDYDRPAPVEKDHPPEVVAR